MEKKEKLVEDLDVEDLALVLEKWGMEEYVDFVRERQIDGLKLWGVSEGLVKLWRPKTNAKKFIEFVEHLKTQPDKYLPITKEVTQTRAFIEAQYQTVPGKKVREQLATATNVEEILKKIAVPKSFLYRNQPARSEKAVTSYTPMESGTPRKTKKFFSISSYEYPIFDVKHFRFSRHDNFNDRGYYAIKNNKHYVQHYKKPEQRKYRSLSTTEDLERYPEEHFYEDLNYNDMDKQDNIKELKPPSSTVKPCMVKIQELFHSFKLPFFKKTEESEAEKALEVTKSSYSEKDGHIYENSDSIASMYDSIHVAQAAGSEKPSNLPVEDYLEPVQLTKDYCDVASKQRDDSILGYILSIFDNFSMRRETTDVIPEDTDQEKDVKVPDSPDRLRGPMTDRPLPVPVENEPYFMNIDRNEAENLLRGQPDGTFVLRPSSQPNHAYTLTVSCSNAVHNVGVRRRPDGRLALGFARRGERSFISVTSLLRHHKKRRLLLVAGGEVCGATTLNESPQYYQTPSSLPLSH